MQGEVGDGCFSEAEGDLAKRVHYIHKHTHTETPGLGIELFIVCAPQPFHCAMCV